MVQGVNTEGNTDEGRRDGETMGIGIERDNGCSLVGAPTIC